MEETRFEESGSNNEPMRPNGSNQEFKDMVKDARVWAKDTLGNTRIKVEHRIVHHPWQTVAIAAISGVTFGQLASSVFTRERAPRRFAPGLEEFLVGAMRLFQKQRVQSATTRIGEQLRETLGKAAASARSNADEARAYMSEQTAGEIAEGVSSLVRRHPVSSALLCIGIGYILARGRD